MRFGLIECPSRFGDITEVQKRQGKIRLAFDRRSKYRFSPIQISRLQKPHALIEAVLGVIRVDHQRFIQHSERFIPPIHDFEHIGEIA